MTIELIKSQIHDMVWDSDDEVALEKLLAAANDILGNPPRDILDDLSPVQLSGLQEALQQAERGEGIPHAVVQERIAQWLHKK